MQTSTDKKPASVQTGMVAKRVSSHTWYIFAAALKALKATSPRRTLARAPGALRRVVLAASQLVALQQVGGEHDHGEAPGGEQGAGDGDVGEEGGEVHGVGSVGAWVSEGGDRSVGSGHLVEPHCART